MKISEKLQKEIDKAKSKPLYLGQTVLVKDSALSSYPRNPNKTTVCKIVNLSPLTVKDPDYRKEIEIQKNDIETINIRDIGANPFSKRKDSIRPLNYQLSSIAHMLFEGKEEKYVIEGVKVRNTNWNPFVYNSAGRKEYYQRDFVWDENDNQLLIESIYKGIQCGRILVRSRAWSELEAMAKKGETELYWNDIVDGKQRLNAIRGFLNCEYTDMHGNYFNDLSALAQHKFTDHQLFSYCEMPNNSKDEDVIYQFLKLNFAGVPQSKEHIAFVESIQNKL